MKTVIPGYYKTFHCIASDCAHNCCLEGWEIDLDDSHVELYKKLAAEQPEKGGLSILDGLVLPGVRERRNGAVPHIRLDENGVCPFLNSAGLCSLILSYGEKALCQICTDHPRFRNYYKDHMELGLGLCCEEACRIILEDRTSGRFEDLKTGCAALPEYQKRNLKEKAAELSRRTLDFKDWAEYLLGLECLEGAWRQLLEEYLHTVGQEERGGREITGTERTESSGEQDRCFDNLENYFLFRHGMSGGAGFASFSTRLIRELAGTGRSDTGKNVFSGLPEICRLYSSEVEYSEENRTAVLRKLAEEDYQ